MAMRKLAVLAAGAACALTACSLFTSLGDLSEGDTKVVYVDKDGGATSDDASAAADAGRADDAGTTKGDAAPDPQATAYAAAVLGDAPRAYWRLEEDTGTIAKDETGRYDGAYKGTGVRGAPGMFGGKALGIGTDAPGYVLVPTADFRFAARAAFSIELWTKSPDTFTDWLWILSTEDWYAPRQGWSLLTGADRSVMYEVWTPADGGGTIARFAPISAGALVAETWQHVVVTYDGTNVVSYANGARLGTVAEPTDAPDVSDHLSLGCRTWKDGEVTGCFTGGVVDEIAVYDKALGDERVAAHYAAGKP